MEKKSKQAATVVYVNSNCIGRGDDGLGALLMGNFLATLGEFLQDISYILLVNAGVKLACADAEKIENLAALEENGVEILCCTTCLNHFNIYDGLKVGQPSNMVTIVEILTSARKVITL